MARVGINLEISSPWRWHYYYDWCDQISGIPGLPASLHFCTPAGRGRSVTWSTGPRQQPRKTEKKRVADDPRPQLDIVYPVGMWMIDLSPVPCTRVACDG